MDAISPRPSFAQRQTPRGVAGFKLILRLAWRDLSAGARGFGVFLACLAIGTFGIAGVGSLARGLQEGLAAQGRVIVGGDVSFALLQREASDAERSAIGKLGQTAVVATLRAMARAPNGDAALVEIKAVEPGYPTLGHLETEGAASISDVLAAQGGTYGAIVDPALLARLDLSPGSEVRIGAARIALEGEARLRAGCARDRHRARTQDHSFAGSTARERTLAPRQPGEMELSRPSA